MSALNGLANPIPDRCYPNHSELDRYLNKIHRESEADCVYVGAGTDVLYRHRRSLVGGGHSIGLKLDRLNVVMLHRSRVRH